MKSKAGDPDMINWVKDSIEEKRKETPDEYMKRTGKRFKG